MWQRFVEREEESEDALKPERGGAREKFEGLWSEEFDEEVSMGARTAEKMREWRMWVKILEAVETKQILFGIGEDHLSRLMPLLEAHHISNMYMSGFITLMKEQHRQ